MKRYRIFSFDFDSRSIALEPIREEWEEATKEQARANQQRTISRLKLQYGEANFDEKIKNFIDLGPKPFSIVAFHNKFLSQVRESFSHGQYYPALTGVCALGERVLNHLVINLRDHYKSHELYKKVYRKKSFDYWPLAIDALSQWGVLTQAAEISFYSLNEKRNYALHFNPEVDVDDRELALEAIRNFEEIIKNQFSSFGMLPWLLPTPGECYIKKEWETSPFVQLVYFPNCAYVGYRHTVVSAFPWQIADYDDYPEQDVNDEDFVKMRNALNDR
ncbi:hypothetical protein JHS3_13510 [Jeongeupia sp. HS-3]|uniref:hypothetical protein n=1 Tax=Jeongeupia sp. HS-3 TaxID=1009682 RepID=UPI0018A48F96|nr:hypothetical protein [Jeongeupia sp. HS-3]BCL75615.1 hypothetical protein JHS3_13510 [Jeongeupia sp. HS-3]